jgi:hypothetical protein
MLRRRGRGRGRGRRSRHIVLNIYVYLYLYIYFILTYKLTKINNSFIISSTKVGLVAVEGIDV